MAFIFEKLDLYKKAVDLAENISRITESFPQGSYYLSDQLNRAALSISATAYCIRCDYRYNIIQVY